MDNELQENNHTTTSFSALSDEIEDSLKKRRLQKLVFGAFSLCFFLLAFLYFVLPSFQSQNGSVEGLINFSSHDVMTLAGLNHYQPSFLLDKDKAAENVLTHADGLIVSCEFESNGFSTKATVQEDYPVATYSGAAYLSSGLTFEEALGKVEGLSLENSSIEQIKTKLTYETEQSLPSLHLPSGTEASKENLELALNPLQGMPVESLPYLYGIQYLNEHEDSVWNNVAQVLVKNNGHYFLLDGLRADRFWAYFSKDKFPSYGISNLEKEIESGKMKTVSYQFQDDSTIYDAYYCKVIISENNVVDFILE